MAHRLGMDIVAEGIENEDTYQALQDMGCTTAQGYLISPPLPLPEFLEKFVISTTMWPSTPLGLLYMAQLDHIEWRKNLLDMIFHPSKKKTVAELYS